MGCEGAINIGLALTLPKRRWTHSTETIAASEGLFTIFRVELFILETHWGRRHHLVTLLSHFLMLLIITHRLPLLPYLLQFIEITVNNGPGFSFQSPITEFFLLDIKLTGWIILIVCHIAWKERRPILAYCSALENPIPF